MKRAALCVWVIALFVLSCTSNHPAKTSGENTVGSSFISGKLSDEAIVQAVHDAYMSVYPLVTMEITRNVFTNVARATVNGYAPVNQFGHKCIYPDAAYRQVNNPDVDMYYSSAFIDLRAEPLILHVPDEMGRYYLLLLLDAWANVFDKAVSTGAADFFITGPGWKGAVPSGMKHITAPTNRVWIAGRTQVNDKTDGEIVKSILYRYTLTPMHAWGKSAASVTTAYTAEAVAAASPEKQLLQMSVVQMLQLANRLMVDAPPHWNETMHQRMEAIQVGPGKAFDITGYSVAVQQALKEIPNNIKRELEICAASSESCKNGWNLVKPVGLQLLQCLGAGMAEDAAYLVAKADENGKLLHGGSRYRLHFTKEQLPAVKAFWSLTLYDKNRQLVANEIDRFAIGDRDRLLYNPDGSLDIYIQESSPGEGKRRNWLPAPAGEFSLTLRLYGTGTKAGESNQVIPPVKKVV